MEVPTKHITRHAHKVSKASRSEGMPLQSKRAVNQLKSFRMTLLLNFLNFLVHLIEFKLKVPLIAQCRVHDFITIRIEDFHLWCLLNQLQRLAASTGGVAQHLNVQRPRTCIYRGLTLTAVFCTIGGWGYTRPCSSRFAG